MFGKTEIPTATPTKAQPPSEQQPRMVRIGDLLLEREIITQEQIERALEYQRDKGHKKLLGEIFVELEFVTQEQVMEVLAEAYDIPFVRLTAKVADPRVIEVLPREFIEKNLILPLFLVHGKLTIAVHEPTNVFLIEEVARVSGHTIQIVAATAKDIRMMIEAHLPNANVFVIDEIVDDVSENDLSLVEKQVTDLSSLEAAADDSPVIKLVNYIIFTAVEEGASDIHIEPGDKDLRVRFRVDGSLFEKMRPPHQMLPAVVSRIKIMSGLDISERRVPQDGGITVMLHKRPVDLRVSTLPGKFGEKVVMRVIDNRDSLATLEQSGFAPSMLRAFREQLQQPNGVILVTGPTGSGKTTTLYGMLNDVADESVNVSSVEDPVEYNLAGINQFQVNERAGFTFASALRALLRQDPDIIMVGEIRDQDTAKICTQAALTGHLVFSTLHTNDAVSAVTRLFNIGVEPYLVAAALRAVLAQRLLRRICKECKEGFTPDAEQQRILDRLIGDSEPITTLFRGSGCAKCRDTGYAGRVGVFELFIPSDELLDDISRGGSLQEIRRKALTDGYVTLREDGIEKVRAGITTIDELVRTCATA